MANDGVLLKCIIGVFIPPLMVFMQKGCDGDFIVNLLLTIFIPLIGGLIHGFVVCFGLSCYDAFLAFILPPFGICSQNGCTFDFWICCLLCCFGWLPGVVYGLYTMAVTKGSGALLQ